MEKHTPEQRRKERIEEVMLEVCKDNFGYSLLLLQLCFIVLIMLKEPYVLIRNGLLILIGTGGRNIITAYNNMVVDL